MTDRDDNVEYTVEELFEQAKDDESWEPDPKIREEVVAALARQLLR